MTTRSQDNKTEGQDETDINAKIGYLGNALHTASYKGDESTVHRLLAAGADVNAKGGDYDNALQTASYRGFASIVQTLLQANADVNAQGGFYGTALQAASYRGDRSIVRQLIQAGANVNAQGGVYHTALLAAIQRQHEPVVQELLEAGASDYIEGGEYGTALQNASYRGKLSTVRQLIQAGVDINAQGGVYCTALLAAIQSQQEAVVKELLKAGVDFNARGGDYGSALQAAAYQGSESIVKLLIDKGADINARGGLYGSALQAAAYQGSESIIKLLIDKGADINAQGGKYGSALQAAAYQDSGSIIKLLIDAGADVNARGGEYGSALQAAAYQGFESIVKLLIDNKADVNARGGEYGSALQAAAYQGSRSITELLIDTGANVNAQGGKYGSALQAAAYKGSRSITELLIDAGADVNAQGGKYGSALQAAAYKGSESITELLIDAGADVNAQGGEYGSALQAAAYQGSESIIRLLMNTKANFNARGLYRSALQAAAFQGSRPITKLPINTRVNVNAQGGEYGSALQAAAYQGSRSITELLIDAGANVNAQGGEYGSALQAAAYKGSRSVTELLIDAGADVNAQGGKYGSALQAAAYQGSKSIIKLLIDAGADVNAQGGEYGSALQAAAYQGSKSIVELLIDATAKVNAQGTEHSTALQAASLQGHEIIEQQLIDAGAEHGTDRKGERLGTELLGREGQQGPMEIIRNEVLRVVPEISGETITTKFQVYWDLRKYLDQENLDAKHMQSILTFSGGIRNAVAMRCDTYMKWLWPNSEFNILKTIENMIETGDSESKSVPITIKEKHDPSTDQPYLEIDFTGERAAIIQVAQQLSWLTATFRPSNVQAMTLSHISFTHVYDLTFKITLRPSVEIVESVICWHHLIKKCHIASDFPIPERRGEVGLEIGLRPLLELSGVSASIMYGDRLAFYSFNTLLYPVSQMYGHNSTQWHFVSTTSGEGLSSEEILANSSWSKIENLSECRTFVGHCGQASIKAGTENSVHDISESGLSAASAVPTLKAKTLTGGTGGLGVFEMKLGFDIVYTKGLSVWKDFDCYEDIIFAMRKESILVYDVGSERGWLLPAHRVLLHLAQTWILEEKIQAPIPYASIDSDTAQVEQILKDEHNLFLKKLLDDDSEFYFRDLIKRICKDFKACRIAQRQRQDDHRDNKSSSLEGWEMIDFVTPPVEFVLKTLDLGSDSYGWESLVKGRNILTLFSSNIGELISPAHNHGICPQWSSLPRTRHLLTATLSCFKPVTDSTGEQKACMRVADGLFWEPSPSSILEHCQNENGRGSTLFQHLSSRPTSEAARFDQFPATGAIVFGSNRAQRWRSMKGDNIEKLQVNKEKKERESPGTLKALFLWKYVTNGLKR